MIFADALINRILDPFKKINLLWQQKLDYKDTEKKEVPSII